MMAAEPPPDLGQALHDWHAALARGDRQAKLAARLLVDILVAGGLDERLEEIQARQPQAQPVPPNPARQDTRLDDVLRLATHNVTISAELYRRLQAQEQRVTEIHTASQAAQALLQPCTRLVETLRRLTHRRPAAAERPPRQRPASPSPPLWRQLVPDLLWLLVLTGAVLLLLSLLAITLVAIQRHKPVHPLPPPPAARLLFPPAELPPPPRTRREKPADVI